MCEPRNVIFFVGNRDYHPMENQAEELVDHQAEVQVQVHPKVVLKRKGVPPEWYLCFQITSFMKAN